MVGVLVLFLVLMVLVYEKILVGDGLPFLITFCMILVMGQGSNFGSTVGVGRHHLLSVIQNCFDFVEIRRQVWLSL